MSPWCSYSMIVLDQPFIWTATVEDIIKKIDRARAKVEQIKPGSTLPRGKKKVACL